MKRVEGKRWSECELTMLQWLMIIKMMFKVLNQESIQIKRRAMQIHLLPEVKPIPLRANSKITTLANRHFLIGGITADTVTNDIYQFRINHDEDQRLQWRAHKFQNNVFTPRNSFAVCASATCIYIWGGLEANGYEQKCFSELIEVDVNKQRMRVLPLKVPIGIHSSTMFYDEEKNELMAYGGTDENNNLPAYLYRLKLSLTEEEKEYEWTKVAVKCLAHQGYIWQHSAHLTTRSLFTALPGKFLTVIGGCRFSHTPFKSIIEINLETLASTHETLLDVGIVSHDSVVKDDEIYIFGGATGNDFNLKWYKFSKGVVSKEAGHNAVGCSCCPLQEGVLVYGGISGPQSINGAFLYY